MGKINLPECLTVSKIGLHVLLLISQFSLSQYYSLHCLKRCKGHIVLVRLLALFPFMPLTALSVGGLCHAVINCQIRSKRTHDVGQAPGAVFYWCVLRILEDAHTWVGMIHRGSIATYSALPISSSPDAAHAHIHSVRHVNKDKLYWAHIGEINMLQW